MKLAPEVVLLGDNTMSRLSWTLKLEVQRISELRKETPELDALMTENGWDERGIAWGHIIAGLLDALDFDDEKGRTEAMGEEA